MGQNPNDPNQYGVPNGMNPLDGQVPPYQPGQYDPGYPQGQYDPNFQQPYDPNYPQGQFAQGYPVPQDPQYYPQAQYGQDLAQTQYDPNLQMPYNPNYQQGQFAQGYPAPQDPQYYPQAQYDPNLAQGQYDPNYQQPYDPNYQPQYDPNLQQQYGQGFPQGQFQSPYEPVAQAPYDPNYQQPYEPNYPPIPQAQQYPDQAMSETVPGYQEDPSAIEQLSKTTSVFPGMQEEVSGTAEPGESGFRESYYREYGQEQASSESGENESKKKSKKKLLLILIPSIVAFLGALTAVFFIFIMPKIKGDDESITSKKKRKSNSDYDATEEYDDDDEDEDEDDDDDDDDDDFTVGTTNAPDMTDPDTTQSYAPTETQYVSNTVTSSGQITADQMTSMQSFAKSDIEAELGKVYNVTITNVNLLGSVIIVSNDPADPNTADSVVYLVYQVQLIERVGTVDKAKEYFWYVGFDGVYTDGNLDSNRYKTSSKISGETGWSVSGTDSVDSARSAIVSSKRYTLSEDNINRNRIVTLSPAPDAPETRGMFFPKSSTELIPDDVIKKMTTEEIRYAINEIWARHGYIFENRDMLNYYSQFSWYKQSVPKSRWNDGKGYLNQIETENINKLAKEREARGGNPQ